MSKTLDGKIWNRVFNKGKTRVFPSISWKNNERMREREREEESQGHELLLHSPCPQNCDEKHFLQKETLASNMFIKL